MAKNKYKHSQGQQGEPLKLHFSELNEKEQKVVTALKEGGTLTIAEMVDACGWSNLRATDGNEDHKGRARGNSWVRNSLRRLVRAGWVEHSETVGDGTYRLPKKARDRLRRMKKSETKASTAESAAA